MTVVAVSQRDVPLFLEAVAGLDGYVNAEIRARVRGFLQAQHYKDGASVKQGQLLFSIERTEAAAAAAVAKAALARAHTLQSHNKAQLERRQALFKAGVASKSELDDIQASALDADSQVQSASALLKQALLNLSYTEIRSPVAGVAAGWPPRRSSATSSSARRRTARSSASATSPASSSARRPIRNLAHSMASRRPSSPPSRRRARTRSTWPRRSARRWMN